MATENGQAPLLTAVRRGDRKAVESLLAAGAEVDPVFTPPVAGKVAPLLSGYTPLLIAAADGDAGLVRDLVAAGANVNAVVDGAAVRKAAGSEVKVLEEGRSALMLAAATGEVEVVEILVEAGADARFQSPEGETALSLALQQGHDEIAGLLRSAGAGGTSLDAELVRAIQRRDPDGVRSALAAGADASSAHEDSSHGRYPALVLAARTGDLEIVEALLAAGAGVDAPVEHEQAPMDRTALMVAAEAGHTGAVRALLRAGADPALQDRSFLEGAVGNTIVAWPDKPRRATALILAAERGHAETVEALLEGGADVNGRGAGALPTPLLAAVHGGHPDVVRLLLRAGADVEARTRTETPLSLAVARGSREIVETLLAAGADPGRRAPDTPTPLEIARLSRFDDLVERLTRAGANRPPRPPRSKKKRSIATLPEKDRGIAYLSVGEDGAVFDRDVKGDTLILIRAGVEAVADAFRRHRGAEVWLREAQGKEVTFSSDVYAILRLTGQAWSIVRDELTERRSSRITAADARFLSRELATDSLFFDLDAESETIVYIWYSSGKEKESFGGHGEDFPEGDPLLFVDQRLRSREALVPVPIRGLSGSVGREILDIPGNVERVDLLVLESP